MSWQIRVRDYNTFVANIVFLIMLLFLGGWWYFFGFVAGDDKFVKNASIALFFLLVPVAMSMTHQTSIIVYRLTDKGYEVFSWKPQIDSVKPVMKWTAIVSGVAVLVATFFNPNFLYGLVGPAGFGLLALAMGNSSKYQSLVRGEDHDNRSWDVVEEVVLWRKRNLIGLKMTFDNGEGFKYSNYQKVYCKKHDSDRVVEFIRGKVPKVDYVERKLDVHTYSAQ
ncbi:hypothetical protein HNO53_00535 [Billgrantia antri]|uniref:Uncharacterized protein n=1 Tax=Halomonas sulfidivorans TaxID=2733488 RepID=A0ABX7WAE5_9GAMM|nr:hypothetical protein [Halomonas sulfidivorans]QTP57334.1 hypothetical protein HNO53_00535 [Halomonas sulfidivorans]